MLSFSQIATLVKTAAIIACMYTTIHTSRRRTRWSNATKKQAADQREHFIKMTGDRATMSPLMPCIEYYKVSLTELPCVSTNAMLVP